MKTKIKFTALAIILKMFKSDSTGFSYSETDVKKKSTDIKKVILKADASYRKVTNQILFFSVKKPSIAQLKKTYQSNVRFFSFQTNRIFKGNNVNKIIQRLRERDQGTGSASEKTLEEFRLR